MESIRSLENSRKRLLAGASLPGDVHNQVVEIEIALAIEVVRHQVLGSGYART